MSGWSLKGADWRIDKAKLQALYDITWVKHPITDGHYFDWQIIKNYAGPAIGYVAQPENNEKAIVGVYLILPSNLMVLGNKIPFSLSVYTFTHPEYYRCGIFKTLANATYEKCVEDKISGTVGVPNNNSARGFTDSLGFKVVGNFDVKYKLAFPKIRKNISNLTVSEIDEKILETHDIHFDTRNSLGGTCMFQRDADFLIWRYFKNPKYTYRVWGCFENERICGIVVTTKAKKKGVPVTVIMDFLLYQASENIHLESEVLLNKVANQSVKDWAPVIISLVPPGSVEADILNKQGYSNIPVKLLPHDGKFILKNHLSYPNDNYVCEQPMSNWYFSFGDYDIF